MDRENAFDTMPSELAFVVTRFMDVGEADVTMAEEMLKELANSGGAI